MSAHMSAIYDYLYSIYVYSYIGLTTQQAYDNFVFKYMRLLVYDDFCSYVCHIYDHIPEHIYRVSKSSYDCHVYDHIHVLTYDTHISVLANHHIPDSLEMWVHPGCAILFCVIASHVWGDIRLYA